MFREKLLQYPLITALFFLLVGFSFSAIAEEVSSEKEPDKYVQVHLIADKTQVTAGDKVRIGLVQTIHPKWHTYWLNPGDSGLPTQLDWTLPPGFSVTDLEWPTPQKIPFGPLTNYGYEGQVTLLQTLQLPDEILNTPFMLEAKVNLLVCHDICIPETHDVSIIFNGKIAGSPDKIKEAEAQLPQKKNWKTEFYEKDGNFILKTITEDASILSHAKDLFIAPENWGAIDNNADATLKILNDGFQLTQKRGERDLSEVPTLPFVISYTDSKGQKASLHLTAETTEAHATNSAIQQDNVSSISLFKALVFALLGGLILNLMPCVFPVLSMKALSLINLSDTEEKKARSSGLSYTAGILVSFATIAGILILLKAGGSQIGWGFQLQSPVVITLLAYLVFIIGLSLSGFFEFKGRFTNMGQKLTQKSGNRGAFFTGVLATLVATPCTAPFMGAAMGFALTQTPAVSIIVFLFLGFGLALPYLALCYVPALRSKLPKPGHWMETFRQFLAFPMFITAAWLVWILSQQSSTIDILCTLFGMVAIAFSIWLIRVLPEKGGMRILSQILIILSIGFVVVSTLSLKQSTYMDSMQQEQGQNWEAFSTNKLDTLLEGDDPVFTEMTAAWCITCKANERIAIKTASTQALFEELNVQYLKGDWTNQNPEISEYLNSFERQGVPLYVYYGTRDVQTGNRPDPVVLPQILTPGLIEKTIR